ncbi:hypothetical protein ES705_38827 [subsurface metagenome]|jgi:predicted DNA-binding transcriptional regulator AlpA
MKHKIKEIKPKKRIQRILFYMVPDLVKILGLSKLTIRKYLRTGIIPGAVKIGRNYMISSRCFNRWLGKE